MNPGAAIFHLACMTTLASAQDALTWKQLPILPEPLGVASPFAGVAGDYLLVAGGANFPDGMPWEGGKKVWHDDIWMLQRPDGVWSPAGKLSRPLAYGVSVSFNGALICVGGSDEKQHFAEAFKIIWDAKKGKGGMLEQKPLPPLPIPLSGLCGAMVGPLLYVACGSSEPGEKTATNRAFALDLSALSPAWRELPPLPGKPRILAAAGSDGNAFYVFGGAALDADASGKISRTYLCEAWSYHPDAGWKQLADLPKPSVAAASPAPFVKGRFLLAGGDDGSRVGFTPIEKHPGFPATIHAYDIAGNRWSEMGESPAPRATLPCVLWRASFVFPSGEVRPGVRSPEVWMIPAQ